MKGTWQTGDHRATGGVVLAAVTAAVMLGSGAAAAIATAVVAVLIALVVVVVLAAAGLGAYLVHRARQERPAILTWQAGQVAGVRPQLADPVPSAIAPAAPREFHLHLHGVESADVAEIIRRHQAEQ
jgi:hypothetical protein